MHVSFIYVVRPPKTIPNIKAAIYLPQVIQKPSEQRKSSTFIAYLTIRWVTSIEFILGCKLAPLSILYVPGDTLAKNEHTIKAYHLKNEVYG